MILFHQQKNAAINENKPLKRKRNPKFYTLREKIRNVTIGFG